MVGGTCSNVEMSSRIIVKNLPKVITKERVEKHFSKFGQVTDVKLVHTPSGLFRRFAFIGYHDEAQADKSVKYFDKTFIESCRIDVDLAKPYGDKEIPRAWSRHSKAISSKKTEDKEKSDKPDENLEKEYAQRLNQTVHKSKLASYLGELYELDTDPEFAEFLSLHKSKTSSKAWANDDGLVTEKMEKISQATKQKVKPSIVSVESRRPGGKGILLTRTHLKFDKEENDSQHSIEDAVSTNKVLSDLDYLKSKIVNHDYEEGKSEDVNMEEGLASCEEDTANTEKIEEINEGEEPMEVATPIEHPSFTLKMRGVPYKSKPKAIRAFFYPLELLDIRMITDQAGKPTGIAFVDFRTKQDMLDGFSRNRDCIGRRYIELFKEEPLEKKSGNINKPRPWESKEAELKEIESIGESGRLFIRNLSYSITEDELTQLFEKYGPLAEVLLPLDKTTNRSIGLGFVTYVLPENAVRACSELDGQIFHGRLLHILPSKPPVTPQTTKLEQTPNTSSTSSYKKSKQSLLTEKSSSAHNWNSLFLGSNAVADSMADRYDVEKSDLLDAEGNQSLAVRLALGETQLVSETREFLENQGVVLSVFNETKPKRSKNIILVKNLAFGTSEEELKELFDPFGSPARIVLPPGGISALVEFSQASVAKKAFKKLAYTEFKDLPIYLEWAPCGVFEANSGKTEAIVEEVSMGQGSTVFVKNLNFKSNEESLDTLFSKVGKVKKCVVARKANMRDPGNPLSMGYGFIEYEREEDALKAIKRLQGHELDDHKLELKLSRTKNQPKTTQQEKSSKPEQQVSSKLLVRNIPFETGKKEIMQLFGTFGKLKNVRLPLKMGSSSEHRGFCFVEFVTKEDAKRAFDSLRHSTHLYGRRLVLEWAALEESVSNIRAKTSRYFNTNDTAETSIAKKRKLGKELLKTLDCTI